MPESAIAPRRRYDPPERDAAVEALSAAERAAVARVWRSRAANELQTSAVFARVDAGLRALGADPAVLELSARAAEDERRHAEICADVASRYALRVEPAPHASDAHAVSDAVFASCSRAAPALLHVVAQCCLNETIAVGYLKAGLDRATGPLVQQALRALLADEVAHSRIGWAHLGSSRVGPAERELVTRAMPALLSDVCARWLADPEQIHERAPPGHGSLRRVEIAELLAATLTTLVAPGLEHVGLDARSTREWLARGDLAR